MQELPPTLPTTKSVAPFEREPSPLRKGLSRWRNSLRAAFVAGFLGSCAVSHGQETVVANFSSNSLTIVNLANGNRSILSSAAVGTGATFSSPVGVAREASGNIVVGEQKNNSSIYRIDVKTGNRTVASGPGVGTGPSLGFVYGLAIEADGSIIAGDSIALAIYRIDPVTGNRSVVTSASVGSGATMRAPFGILVDSDGSIVFVPWNSASEVIKVHPTTGHRTVISSATVGTGPALALPTGIVRLPDGAYLVLNNGGNDYLLRVDPTTGNRTVISSTTVGTGSAIGTRYSHAIDTSGNFYVADFSDNSIVKIDPVTGNRTTISSSSVGTGANFSAPLGMLSGAVASISTSPPSVTTNAAGNIGASSANLGGNVTADGGAPVTNTGIVWSVNATNATPAISGTGVTRITIGSGVGAFSQDVTGLPAGTVIAYRAFAINSAGTNYGSVVTFTTLAGNLAPTDIALSSSSINQTGGINATVGTLSTTDVDSSTFTYSLVTGAGSTHNASFNLSGATLRVNDTVALGAGTYSVRVQTDDGSGGTFAKSFSITVVDNIPPTITSGTTAGATYKTAFSGYTVTANETGVTFGATGLPTGLSVNPSTGVISGSPTQSGTFTVSLSATDAATNRGTATLTLTVAPLVITVSGVTSTDKPFDGTASAILNFGSAILTGVATNDTVTLNTAGATGTFANADVATGKPVTIAGLVLAGTDAANYTLVQPTTTGNIIRATALVQLGALTATYNGVAHPVTVVTTPSGLTVAITYDGDANAPSNAGTYAVNALVNSGQYVGSVTGTLTIARASQFITFNNPGSIDPGKPVALSATASSGLSVTFSVVSGNASLAGSSLTIKDEAPVIVRAFQAGNSNYLSTTGDYVLGVTRTDRLMNLSSRARITPNTDQRLITGFVIGGNAPKQVLLRAAGPALTALQVTNALSNPRLQLYNGRGELIMENDDWSGAETSATSARIGAFSFVPGSRDAAIMTTLAPGPYTMHVTGGSETGITLAEIYDASATSEAEYQRLVNISSRGNVDTGDGILISGFSIAGNSPKKVLIRGIGPSLATYGVPTPLSDPRLEVYSGNTVIAKNDDWGTPQAVGVTYVPATANEIALAARATGAFELAPASKDASVVMTLPPGAYTVHLISANAQAGLALVEIYEIP